MLASWPYHSLSVSRKNQKVRVHVSCRRKKVRGRFHQLRTLIKFTCRKDWRTCWRNTASDHIFDAMIRQQHQIEGTDTVKDVRITTDQMDAIRYAAGYVPRALQKFLKSAYPLKRQILLCLYDLFNEGEDDADTTWMKQMAKITSLVIHNNTCISCTCTLFAKPHLALPVHICVPCSIYCCSMHL